MLIRVFFFLFKRPKSHCGMIIFVVAKKKRKEKDMTIFGIFVLLAS